MVWKRSVLFSDMEMVIISTFTILNIICYFLLGYSESDWLDGFPKIGTKGTHHAA